jgi:hypothetical protein
MALENVSYMHGLGVGGSWVGIPSLDLFSYSFLQKLCEISRRQSLYKARGLELVLRKVFLRREQSSFSSIDSMDSGYAYRHWKSSVRCT